MENREHKRQELAKRLVEREVFYNVSMLVGTLVNIAVNCNTYGELDYDELLDLCQGRDWETPVNKFIMEDAGLDQLEEIAEHCGYWSDVLEEAGVPETYESEDVPGQYGYIGCDCDCYTDDVMAHEAVKESVVQEIRESVWKLITEPDEYEWIGNEYSLEPEIVEVYEHWLISERLARKLKARGEVVGEVCGLTVFGRCATGQALYMDPWATEIAAEMWPEELAGIEEGD